MKLRITVLKYHLCYLCQKSLQIMLLPILISKQARLNADVKSVLVKGRVDDVDGPALDLNSVPRRIWYQ